MTSSPIRTFWQRLRKHLNFYRVHIICFTFTPLFFSAIFYASNGEFKISYIDSLFNCVSAMTVCGLATVDLSSLTPWQQVILFLQMCLGSPILVSWIMVYTRKNYIENNCRHIIQQNIAANQIANEGEARVNAEAGKRKSFRGFLDFLHLARDGVVVGGDGNDVEEYQEKKRGQKRGTISKLRPDMIRRMSDEPRLINPSGLITEHVEGGLTVSASNPSFPLPSLSKQPSATSSITESSEDLSLRGIQSPLKLSSQHASNSKRTVSLSNTHDLTSPNVGLPRSLTVEFADLPKPRTRLSQAIPEENLLEVATDEQRYQADGATPTQPLATHVSLTTHPTHHTLQTNRTVRSHQSRLSRRSRKNRGFGGFPMPLDIIKSLFQKLFPSLERQPATKQAPYVYETLTVGRNSRFLELTRTQLHQLGGEEYRALVFLLWLVAIYHIGIQLIFFVVIAPYMSIAKWKAAFQPPQLLRPVNAVWYSAFQVVSSYTNTGTSLVDQSMLPFQTAIPTILSMAFLILAGNTCFPIFLRFTIWCLSKWSRNGTKLHNTTHFLLDHPRRCFIYLFPSHQTWFLLTIVLFLTFVDWFFFLILDLGNAALSSIPLNTRVLAGFLQAVAVRAAGFGIVPLAALAPAVKVLYTIMMYISVYPIAMSVRSTNVYEENSLGIFNEEGSEEEENFDGEGPRITVWSRYLAMHARQQLAFDMWWLAAALFLVCIIERGNLTNEAQMTWFNIFNIIFELVSAYGTVGLSLGLPTQNYSFSGSFKPLSKLIVCLVMLRGRHRGLPVAIDRAVMVPKEYQDEPKQDSERQGTQNGTPWGEDERTDTIMTSGAADGSSELHRRITRKPTIDNVYHYAESGIQPRSEEKI